MNKFQKALIGNRKAIWEIVKLFHPDIADELEPKLSVGINHDWVTIKLKGIVDIGINFECRLYSGSKPLHLFVKEYEESSFRLWRFASDSKYKRENDADYTYLRILYRKIGNGILEHYQIPRPTPKEMSDYYHRD